MKHPIDTFEKEIQRPRLTAEERLHIRERLEREMLLHPLPPIASPYRRYLRAPAFAVFAVALIMFSGGTAFAAENSLPGDALYGVKVNVIEPVEGSLQIGAAAKAKWQVHLADVRLTETEELADENMLSTSTGAELAVRVADATTKAALDVAALESSNPSAASATAHLLDVTVKTHAHAVAVLALSSDASDSPVLAAALSAASATSTSSAVAVSASPLHPATTTPVLHIHRAARLAATSTATASSTKKRVLSSIATTTSAATSASVNYAHALELFVKVRAIDGTPIPASATSSSALAPASSTTPVTATAPSSAITAGVASAPKI